MLSLGVICGLPGKKRLLKPDRGGRPVLIGSSRDEPLRAPAGGAVLYAGSGSDILIGRSGNDVLYGGTGDDQFQAQGSNDVLIGGAGANTEYGSPLAASRTMLVAGPGRNILVAGPGLNYIDSRRGIGANEVFCAGRSVVMARQQDHLHGHCAQIIYQG